jgi:hypothetical protein
VSDALAEWIVCHVSGTGLQIHKDDQGTNLFERGDAGRLASKLGTPWKVNHYHTLVPPHEHDLWLKGAGKRWAP